MDESTLEWLIDCVLDALASDSRVPPAALLLLLRRVGRVQRGDFEEALGAALARELDRPTAVGERDRDEWLALFSEAATLSDDPRLARRAADLLPGVRRSWSGTADVESLMHAVDACLRSVNIPEARDLAPEAIDALERAVARAYVPGRGIAHSIDPPGPLAGAVEDQVYAASALLTAYTVSARLPYAMLADELMQVVCRRPSATAEVPFTTACDEATVFCRLAALHRDGDYRRSAVLSEGTDYAQEAAETLRALVPAARARRVDAAPFGLALAHWLELQQS